MSALIAEGKYPNALDLCIDNSSSNQHLRTVAARWIVTLIISASRSSPPHVLRMSGSD